MQGIKKIKSPRRAISQKIFSPWEEDLRARDFWTAFFRPSQKMTEEEKETSNDWINVVEGTVLYIKAKKK